MDPRAGREPINALGVLLAVGLALLIVVLFGYTFIRWFQRHRPDFVFNLYHTCGLGSVAVELVPPFSISGSLSRAGSGYEPFHNRGP